MFPFEGWMREKVRKGVGGGGGGRERDGGFWGSQKRKRRARNGEKALSHIYLFFTRLSSCEY